MKPQIVLPPNPTFCSVCGTRLPTERAEDEGLHCAGTIVTQDPEFPDDPAKTLSAPCKAVYWPPAATGVVVVLQPVIDDDGTIGILEVQRKRRDGSVRDPDDGWCFPSGYTKLGNSLEEDAGREEMEESGVENDLTNPVELGEDGDEVVLFTNSVVLDAETATEGHLMVLILAKPVHKRDLAPFVENRETSARRIGKADDRLTFSIHRRWKQRFFSDHYAAQCNLLPAPS